MIKVIPVKRDIQCPEDNIITTLTKGRTYPLSNSYPAGMNTNKGRKPGGMPLGNLGCQALDLIGNVALKISESLAEMIGANLKLMFQSNWFSKLGYLFLKPKLIEFKKKVDHSETGGAPLLGVNGVVIIAHGSSCLLYTSPSPRDRG